MPDPVLSVCLSIMQAAFSPALSHASDQLGQRKYWLILPQLPMIAGAFIASRAVSMPNLLAGQLLVGFGLATTPIAWVTRSKFDALPDVLRRSYAAPSEILPRRYRPMAQAIINFGGNCAATVTYVLNGRSARIMLTIAPATLFLATLRPSRRQAGGGE